jgi:E-phenylitaconyl-CoA hydratase
VTTAPEDLDLATLLVERHDRVLLVTMNRPDRLNAYDRTMVEELRSVWRHADLDEGVHALVLTAAGTRGFSTGFDVDDTLEAEVVSPSLDEHGQVAITARDLGINKPVVVAVNGFCCAGGWHFVDDADVVLASETASFFDTHVDVGLANPVEAVGMLSKLPAGEVLRMVLSGRDYRLGAQRAHELGLVTEVVPGERLVERALEIAAVIAQHPVELLRTSLETLWTAILEQRASAEAHGLAALARSDASAATRSATMDRFRHRAPRTGAPTEQA